MTYSRISNLQIRKKFLAQQREEQLKKFKSNRAVKELSITREHVWGGASAEVYKKKEVSLHNGDSLDIITNQNLTRDTTILWYTTGDTVKKALRMGLLEPQTLTSKAIKALGLYRKKAAERAVKSRIESQLAAEKELLVKMAQDRIEWLQDFELYLGHRIYADSVESVLSDLEVDFKYYLIEQNKHANDKILTVVTNEEKDTAITARQREFNEALTEVQAANRAENQRAAEELKRLIEENTQGKTKKEKAEWLQTTGNEEILSFIRARTLAVVRQTQGLNQVLTHQAGSGANLRGDLNNFCEDARKITRDHKQDWHNPVTADHQLTYKNRKKVIIDTDFHTDGSLGQLEDVMMAVSELSGGNDHMENLRGEIRKTAATKWLHWRSFYDSNPYAVSVFSSWKGFKEWVKSWFLAPFKLVETAFRGAHADFFISFQDEPEANQDCAFTDYYALTHLIHKQTDISIKIGLELYKIFNYLLVDGLWKGLQDGWKQIKRLPEDIAIDFQDQEAPLETVLQELKTELKQLQDLEDDYLGCDLVLISLSDDKSIDSLDLKSESEKYHNAPILIKKLSGAGEHQTVKYYGYSGSSNRNYTELKPDRGGAFDALEFGKDATPKLIPRGDVSLNWNVNRAVKEFHNFYWYPKPQGRGVEAQEEKKQKTIRYAQPDISLKPYESHGIVNGAVSGFNGFVDLFGHGMFAKHPFTALFSSMGAAMSFMAFFAPTLAIRILGKNWTQFLLDQGYIWTKDAFSASTAGAFTNFKIHGGGFEAILHGWDSWLSKGVSYVLNDPAKAVTFTTLSWTIGYSLVYLINIPWLSEELKSHIGDPKELSLIFGGAKLGVIGYHLFVAAHAADEVTRQEYINECLKNYKKFRKNRKGRSPTPEQLNKLRECLEKVVSPEAVGRLRVHIQGEKRNQEVAATLPSPQETEFSTMMYLFMNKEKLGQLSPLLKAKIQQHLPQLAGSREDARAIDKLIDTDKYAPKSTLRSFLGRAIGYVPTLLRCILSPLALLVTRSSASATRPWKDLGEMILDDVTSTVHELSKLTNKILESLFNRIPRTLADILVNSIIARVASFFRVHKITQVAYELSANYDLAQEALSENTTGRVLNVLARENSAPHPESGLRNAFECRVQAKFHPKESEPESEPESESESEPESEPESESALSRHQENRQQATANPKTLLYAH